MSFDDAKRPIVLILDVGTSSLRAQIRDGKADAIPDLDIRVPHRVSRSSGGRATLDADEILDGVASAVDQVLEQAGSLAQQVGGVAAATLVSNVLGVDSQGRPLTPVYTYADTQSRADTEELRRQVDGQDVHDRTGCLLHSSYLPARFRWLNRTQPDLLSEVARWISIGEYLYWHFFESHGVSHSVASWSGLLNRHTLNWDEEWISSLPVNASQFSDLVDINQPLVGLVEPWARRWPALAKVPWFPAVGDGAAANLGSGCAGPDRLAITIGTTAAVRAVLKGQVDSVPPGLWSYRLDRRRSLLGGATSDGGSVYDWMDKTLKLPNSAELEEALAGVEPATPGLAFMPFLSGERSPGWRDDARASFVGLTLATRPVEMLRAALEGVAYRLALIHQLVRPHLFEGYQIHAGGAGLLASPVWLQILADVFGLPITSAAEQETTGRGVALLALESLGAIEDIGAMPLAGGHIYDPEPRRHEHYQVALQQHQHLYQLLVGPELG